LIARFQLVAVVRRRRKDKRQLIGNSGSRDSLRRVRMRGNPKTLSPSAATAAAACWLMGIAGVLTSMVAAGSETAAGRRAGGRHDGNNPGRSTASADLPWPTAISGQFLLPRRFPTQLISDYRFVNYSRSSHSAVRIS